VLQVISQFATLVAQMKNFISNDVPWFLSIVSTGSDYFDIFLRVFYNSAIAAISAMALLVPLLWASVFGNWRSRIMEMRQGRSV
jgi:hypothetical protein